MSAEDYTPLSIERIARIWPTNPPAQAWTHSVCNLVVTNRADHEMRGGPYQCRYGVREGNA